LVPAEGKDDDEGYPASWIRAWAVIVAAWLSTWLLQPLGFLVSTTLFLLVFLLVMGVRSWKMLIGFPTIYTLVTWYIFSQLLKIILPLGPLTRLARSLGLTP
jgi:putative tricarboxylic transport membrane protein